MKHPPAILLFLSQFLSYIQASPSKPKGEQSSDEGSEFWPPFYGYRVKVTDSLLVIFTFLLWIATRGLVKSAERASERQLRAYGSVETEPIKDTDGNPVHDKIGLEIRNCGQTPAYDLWHWTGIDIQEFPLRSALLRPNNPIKAFSVVNPDRAVIIIIDFPVDEMQKMSHRIRGGKIALYIWGEVKFLDIFDDEHTTEFVFFMDEEGLGHQRFANYVTGNKAT